MRHAWRRGPERTRGVWCVGWVRAFADPLASRHALLTGSGAAKVASRARIRPSAPRAFADPLASRHALLAGRCGTLSRGLASIATCLAALAAASAGGQIPADVGQVWKTYDLGPFVETVGPESEKHVVDWILQETGYPAWHGANPASLSAADGTLACFHTPEMQARVADIVDRFVAEADKPHRFSVRVLGLDGPAWRAEARPALQPIPTATPGVQAWILPREDAVAVVARLRSRSDATELPTGPVQAGNGLPAVLTGGRKQEYVQDYAATPVAWPGWQPQRAACDEGLSIEFHPLVSGDGSVIDAVFKCRIDQIERMAQVALPAPAGGPPIAAQVPQVAAVRIGERFRWPSSHSLVVALGLVPWPVPVQNGVVAALMPDVERRDVVVVVEPRLSGP